MSIKLFDPAFQVILQKQVRRKNGVAERYAPPDQIDLTPYLDANSVVRTRKSIYEPMGGFSISFGDKIHPGTADTVYALVEPMDIIEIRGSRTPHLYAGGRLPLIMRGFVGPIRRTEEMSHGGKPRRMVTITGNDAGKLWQIQQVNYRLAYFLGYKIIADYQFQVTVEKNAAVLKVSDFMSQLVEWMNKFSVKMYSYSQRQLLPFVASCTVPEGTVMPESVSPYEGPAWGIAEMFADRPWNELWIEDTEAAPILHFRPAPYKDLDGNFIMTGTSVASPIEMDAVEVTSISVERSDRRIANVFWTSPEFSDLNNAKEVQVAALQTGQPFDFTYDNNRPELYGYRIMQANSRLVSDSLTHFSDATDVQDAAGQAYQQLWYGHRATQLRLMNRDNSVLEEGSMEVRGDEKLKVGRYLRLTRGDFVMESYLTGVAHTFIPLTRWRASLMVERGTGFLTRIKSDKSPYWREGRPGALP